MVGNDSNYLLVVNTANNINLHDVYYLRQSVVVFCAKT